MEATMEKAQPPVDNTEGYGRALKELSELSRLAGKAVESASKVLKVREAGKNISLYAAEEIAGFKKTAAALREKGKIHQDALVSLEQRVAELEAEALGAVEKELSRKLTDLEKLLSAKGHSLSGHYPELTCDMLSVSFVRSAAGLTVNVSYGPGLEKLGSSDGDVENVAKAVLGALDDLDRSLMPDEAMLALLHSAWRSVLFRKGLRPEATFVPILDALAELCFLRQDRRFFRNPLRGNFTSYGQAAFSYQLFKLKTRLLGGEELMLGVATREDVKNRESLWVPRNLRGEGVHYSKLGFRRMDGQGTDTD
jgi:hypothetical protein